MIMFSSCQIKSDKKTYEKGVSIDLAKERFLDISGLEYHLEMNVPDSLSKEIKANAVLNFQKKNTHTPIVLDFTPGAKSVEYVLLNDEKVFYSIENEHIIIPTSYIKQNKNKLEIGFVMGEGALNRNSDYLYTLFVPDRARTAIPCFDQPDLKAKVSYSIFMPKDWLAITNGIKDYEEEKNGNIKHVSFAYTKPISTYLWAFAVGKFSKVTEKKDSREISIYHMEKDSDKIKNNVPALFNQAFHSIKWLEEYTGIPFPFQKYDMVCIPSFQFSGMEHPGAVYYRQEKCFLSDKPTQKEKLNRATVIAHETSHMWFGDLVTMKWFSGVWQKEVFANFIADKIVKEQFPNVNYDLAFMVGHFPAAFSVDRTIAANPIEQKLLNLKDAGSLYGNIIYHKAPIVMHQLEKLMGADMLQKGLGLYLKKFSYGNASWNDLIQTLNDLSEYDLNLWSDTWVNESGRPVVSFEMKEGELVVKQHHEFVLNPKDSLKVWAQRFNCAFVSGDSITQSQAELLTSSAVVSDKKPDYIFPSVDQDGYGLFLFDSSSAQYAMKVLPTMKDNLMAGALMIHLYENLLANNKIDPEAYLKMLSKFIKNSFNEQLINLACDQMNFVLWRCLDTDKRAKLSVQIENVLLQKADVVTSIGLKKVLLKTWSSVATSSESMEKLKQLVFVDKSYNDVAFSNRELVNILLTVVLKDPDLDDAAIYAWADKINDEDLKGELRFVAPVFSKDAAVFNDFVEGLGRLENRAKENWVLTALKYIHHPFLNGKNIRYVEDEISLMPEVKNTGSLFFPMSWINVILRGYNSNKVVSLIDYYFKDHPDFPEDLKMKVLQAADAVKRSANIIEIVS